MDTQDVWAANRAMLVHFDSYSAALMFARLDGSLLLPGALPEEAELQPPPAGISARHDGEAVKAAAVERLGLNPDEVIVADDFDHWVHTADGPVKIHLLRFNTFEAPKALLEPHGGTFKAISELRGSARLELALAREVFNLIIGAGGGRA